MRSFVLLLVSFLPIHTFCLAEMGQPFGVAEQEHTHQEDLEEFVPAEVVVIWTQNGCRIDFSHPIEEGQMSVEFVSPDNTAYRYESVMINERVLDVNFGDQALPNGRYRLNILRDENLMRTITVQKGVILIHF